MDVRGSLLGCSEDAQVGVACEVRVNAALHAHLCSGPHGSHSPALRAHAADGPVWCCRARRRQRTGVTDATPDGLRMDVVARQASDTTHTRL